MKRKVTVVTGASTGIGRAVVERQARAGDRVWALVRNPSGSQDLADLARHEDLDIRVIEADVTDDASVEEAFGRVLHEDEAVDRLVNNAGQFLGSTLESHSLDEVRAMFEVNYFGAIRSMMQVVPGMRRQRSGVIAVVTSQSSQAIFPTWTAYAGSKGALEASLESLAMELGGFGIRINVIQPGITLTAMRGKIQPRTNLPDYDEVVDRYRTLIAADRTESMEPDDVARAIESVLIDGSSSFRTRIGVDAVRNIEVRQSVSDDEWIRLFAKPTDDEFYGAWSAIASVVDPRTLRDEALVDPQ